MTFAERIINWQKQHGRHHLPWQCHDPYRIWLSEIMLQQTQVTTVIPYYQKFTESFPTVIDLANATQDSVLAHWAGLGYYARARNLHQAAQQIRDEFGGKFPQTRQEIETLKGVGRSTAAAIAAFAFAQKEAILDGNVKRILARHHTLNDPIDSTAGINQLWQLAERALPKENIRAYTQGLMDLGSLICTRSQPNCPTCPINNDCQAYQKSTVEHYPKKKNKKAKPEKHGYFLLATHQQKLLLEKRPEKGIWGGLWSLPWFESVETLQTHYPTLQLSEPPLYHRHIFTHFVLHLHIYRAELNDTVTLSAQQQLVDNKARRPLGLPAPIQTILSDYSR